MNPLTALLHRIEISDRTADRLLAGHTILLFVFIYVPILVVALLSFTPQEVPTFPMPGISLEWYGELVPPNHNEQLVDALFRSVAIGILSAIGAGIVGTIAAFGLVRYEFEHRLLSRETLNTVFLLPLVVPWIVTGIAVLTLYDMIGIRGTFFSVVLGHVLITIPFVVIIVSSQLYGLDRSIEEAAKNLGATELRTFYEITLPILAPSIIAGMLFAFTISFDNFTQTFFWATTGTETLPIVIYSMIRTGIDPSVNAIGTVIVLFSLSVAFLGERLSKRILE
ncbi:ABC transporter permease [Natrarchaeobius halalkaliphilus]|uniref:ABC transporter permease n=1 Tax=Natrarchaeobius halalkaliphilus TaxID=1679091 RepID=A0A3N6LZ42_9EURY|nr:ABC transporter permease [Natrarchaeobius halalkaliphilus]RQG87993.1 ABC transporter permease [Natrarchaeobius halalkaliphilus]